MNKYLYKIKDLEIPLWIKRWFLKRSRGQIVEVEGIPPLIFRSNGENLLDYRIDGASGGVGERTKNFIQNTATTQTKNGVTFTVNEDKSISCNGTASSNVFFKIGDIQLKENCIMSGCPEGGANNSYVMRLYNNGSVFKTDSGDGVLISSEIQNGYTEIRIAAGYTCDNLTFYPMIRLAEIEDNTYEPYGYKVPVVVSGKNLFDGIYGANHFSQIEPDKTITISTKSTGESSITFVYKKSDGTRFRYTRLLNENETSGSVTVTTPSEAVGIGIYAATDYTSQTIAYDTLIEYGDRATTYEPYHEPTTTNIYLDEPIEDNESISLSDTNVPIPTLNGTNILTVDTTVQPSKVYIKTRVTRTNLNLQMKNLYNENQPFIVDSTSEIQFSKLGDGEYNKEQLEEIETNEEELKEIETNEEIKTNEEEEE